MYVCVHAHVCTSTCTCMYMHMYVHLLDTKALHSSSQILRCCATGCIRTSGHLGPFLPLLYVVFMYVSVHMHAVMLTGSWCISVLFFFPYYMYVSLIFICTIVFKCVLVHVMYEYTYIGRAYTYMSLWGYSYEYVCMCISYVCMYMHVDAKLYMHMYAYLHP